MAGVSLIRVEHSFGSRNAMATQYMPALAGQAALVTGATSGIGLATAIALAKAGCDVVVNHRDQPDKAAAVVRDIEAVGRRAIACPADVSDERAVLDMFAEAVRTFGTLDIVIANAGVQSDAPIGRMTLTQWQQVLGINLTGQFLCARAGIGEFRRRGRRAVSRALGKIICISSVHQDIPWAGHVNYAASKGGVAMMMKSMAQEVAPEGIRVNAIAPGAVRTNINRSAWASDAALDALLTLVPYGRIGEPEDVANAAVWLASDASDYVVGTTLYVDGGMMLYPGFSTNG